MGATNHEQLRLANLSQEDILREWRDLELKNTDWIIAITDHPERDAYITYRQALRDWPSTESFPVTKPTL
jgi:hypothetical protein